MKFIYQNLFFKTDVEKEIYQTKERYHINQ